MSAHWIGKKKLSKFSRKAGIEFISGMNESGTPLYVLLSAHDVFYHYNRLLNVTHAINLPDTTKELFKKRAAILNK